MYNEIKQRLLPYIQSEVIFERGYEYFESERIINFTENELTIAAKVLGNGAIYNVIIFKRGTIIQDAICDCPYEGNNQRCKHIAAVLINSIYNGLLATKRKSIPKPSSLKIEDYKGNNLLALESNEDQTSKNTKLWKLIFLLDIENQSMNYGLSPIIKPSVRYIKKDGTLGALSKYTFTKQLSDTTESELVLVEKIGAQGAPLKYYFDFILQKNIPIYRADMPQWNYEYQLVHFEKIKKMIFHFELNDIVKKTLFFNTTVSVYGKEQELLSYRFLPLNLYFDGTYLGLMEKNSNVFFYREYPVVTLNSLKKLSSYSNGRLNYATIQYIASFLKNESSIHFPFEFDEVRFEYINPQLILYIDEQLYKITIEIFFRYGTEEIPYNSNKEQIYINKGIKKRILYILGSDGQYEREIMVRLRDAYPAFFTNPVNWFKEDEEFEINNLTLIDFLKKYAESLIDEFDVELRLKKNKQKIYSSTGTLQVVVKHNIDWFDVHTEYAIDGKASPVSIDKYLLKHGLIRVNNNYTMISKKDRKKLEFLLEQGMSKEGELKASKYNFFIIDELYKDIVNKKDKDVKQIKQILNKLKNFHKIKKQSLSSDFHGTLRPYQQEGVNWLRFLFDYELNGCLADDMGLGKTIQTLAFLQSLKSEKKIKQVLLVVPVAVILNWENEIKQFTPQLSYQIHIGMTRKKDIKHLQKYDVIITSYHTLRNDIDIFKEIEFDYIILDEAQNIKNSKALLHKSVKILKSKHKLTLTGTPIENNTLELWAQMSFLNPGLLDTLTSFKRKFAIPIEGNKDEEKMSILQKMIYPFIMRRKKNDVLKDLPEKTEIILYADMTPTQKKLYDDLKNDIRQQISEKIKIDGVNKSAISILAGLLKLRQIALFPSLLDSKYPMFESGKFEILKEKLEEGIKEGHKILIFSQFVQVLKILQQY